MSIPTPTITKHALPFSGGWESVGTDGSTVVALARYETNAATSADGKTWVERASAVAFQEVFSAPVFGGGKFVATSVTNDNGSNAIVSADGVSWAPHSLPVAASFSGTAFGAGLFVAVGYAFSGGSARIISSPDGETWTNRTTPSGDDWTSVVWNGSGFCAVSFEETCAVSSDGQSWSLASGAPTGVSALCADESTGTIYGKGSGNDLWKSDDNGDTWSSVSLPTPPAGNRWSSVVGAANGRVCAAYYSNSNTAGDKTIYVVLGDGGSEWEVFEGPEMTFGTFGNVAAIIPYGDAFIIAGRPSADALLVGIPPPPNPPFWTNPVNAYEVP